MTTGPVAPPRPVDKAEAWSGIRDIDIQIGEAAPGQEWPGGPYRGVEWVAIAAIAGPTLLWVDSQPAGTTLPVLAGGVVLCVVTVGLMRLLLPKGRPSLSARLVFARNTIRPPHLITSQPRAAERKLRVDSSFDPPERVEDNLVFTGGGVYAEFLIDGLSVNMRSLDVHRRAARLTRNLGRYLPSGSQVRGLLVAEDQNAIMRAMVGPHTNKSTWIGQCKHWVPTIAQANKWITKGYRGPVRPRFWLTVPVDAGTRDAHRSDRAGGLGTGSAGVTKTQAHRFSTTPVLPARSVVPYLMSFTFARLVQRKSIGIGDIAPCSASSMSRCQRPARGRPH